MKRVKCLLLILLLTVNISSCYIDSDAEDVVRDTPTIANQQEVTVEPKITSEPELTPTQRGIVLPKDEF